MIDRDEVKKVLDQFVNYVVRESKRNAPRASGDLKKSIKGETEVFPNSIKSTIYGEDYLKFIDRGVKGVESGRSLSGYRYRDKRPPVRFLQTWLKRKSGKFLARDRKSAAFALQNHIFKYGIKPTRFFTTPFETAYSSLPDEIIEAYGLDIENFMELVLNDDNV